MKRCKIFFDIFNAEMGQCCQNFLLIRWLRIELIKKCILQETKLIFVFIEGYKQVL